MAISGALQHWTRVKNVGTNIRKPTVEYTAEDFSFLMSTNLESAYHLCQLARSLLKRSGNRSIVLVSSVAGVVALSSGSIYAASKEAKATISITKKLSYSHCKATYFISLW
ncbi:Senescence-associated protein 13 [Nymphaea thermarum]|nr:Senescence-associated protein 13 [Nymphaea thermarum]